jgi:hypothetical protein
MQFEKKNYQKSDVVLINVRVAKRFCIDWHYSNIFPPHVLLVLGFYDDVGLAGVSLWGWGVRPVHTIQKLFPSLSTKDYFELNRLCLRDDVPKNAESWFLAKCSDYIRHNLKEKVMLLSWADGVRGKPGYIYQAAGWLYGGFIKTEIYLTEDGEPVHPRMLITRYGSRSLEVTKNLGLHKVYGRQFMYINFLCSHKTKKSLLKESTVQWNKNYPKKNELVWETNFAGEVSREIRDVPNIQRSGQFRHSAPFQTESVFDELD